MTGSSNRALMVAAAGEAVTGAALLAAPSLVGRLLLDAEMVGVAVPAARVAGIALIALAIACWRNSPLLGMLSYSAAATLYLAYVGLWGGFTGVLLWPAVAVHALLSILLWRSHTKTIST